MGTRNKMVYFDRMYVGKQKDENKESKQVTENVGELLSTKVEKIYRFFKSKRYSEITETELNGKHLYISAIERFNLPDDVDSITSTVTKQYAYMINIASVDPSEEIKYADLQRNVDKRKIVVKDNDDGQEDDNERHIGPLLDSQIIIDPFRMIVASCRGTGRLTKWEIKKFLKKLLNTRAMSFNVILNKKGLKDIQRMTSRTKFTYSIASPDHFDAFKNDSDSESMDMKFANYMKGNNFKIVVDSENIPWRRLKNKITQLNERLGEKEEVNSMDIEGLNNGVEEKVDLLKNKLTHKGTIIFDNVITIKDFFDMLKQSYEEEFDFIRQTYKIEKWTVEIEKQKKVKNVEEGKNS